jgi:hypothetical protein
MHIHLSRLFLAALLLSAFASAKSFAAEPALLVGNSFTGYTSGQISYRQIFKERWVGGWNLHDHFNNSLTRSMICDRRTFVVLQDFSIRPNDTVAFQIDMDEMVPLVRSCGAVPILFMTWETNLISYNSVSNGYNSAATKHNTQVIAIGTVWNRIRASSESMYQSLLQTDGKHPTVRGAKVNAASLYKAFCSSCYQSFNWSGFTSNEVTLVKSIINQYIVTAVIPPVVPEPEPEEPRFEALLGIILPLLLSEYSNWGQDG